jgi:hypothetical protein
MPDNNQQFAIVPYTGRAPEDAIVTGNLSQVTEYIPQSVARNEKEAQLAQAERDAEETANHQAEVRACAIQILGDGLTHLSNRLDGFETRKQEREEQQRRDAEEAEAAAVEQMLAGLPDPEDPQAMGDDGELEAIKPPPDTEKLDPEHRNEAVTGAMPEELEEGAPSEIGEFGAPLPPPSPYRDPTSIGGS